jgi:hypothetical protein
MKAWKKSDFSILAMGQLDRSRTYLSPTFRVNIDLAD